MKSKPLNTNDNLEFYQGIKDYEDKLSEALHIGSTFVPDLKTATEMMSIKTKELINDYVNLSEEIKEKDLWSKYFSENIVANIEWDSEKKLFVEKISALAIITITDMAVNYGADHPDEIKEVRNLYEKLEKLLETITKTFGNDVNTLSHP